ncbi:3-ketoacyl-CoA synthase 11 [Bonamia ostreae]|uniref:3-ketoacyl-CoA synthase 11 n=1 Tax=Bonamia ostreae TaxID=126728 RepID=A0ABV2AMB4_9EUKA
MRENIKSFNLGGMGCSAGLISVDLASDLLKSSNFKYALVVSTENITMNWYKGSNKVSKKTFDQSMLIPNTLFRVGGAALILTNANCRNCKMELLHLVRTHKGRDDACFDCISQEEDDKGIIGVRLNKNILKVAGKALKTNITVLAPLTLPWLEQAKYILNAFARALLERKVLKNANAQVRRVFYSLVDFLLANKSKRSFVGLSGLGRKLCMLSDEVLFKSTQKDVEDKTYIPDFTKAFDHFCVYKFYETDTRGWEGGYRSHRSEFKASV